MNKDVDRTKEIDNKPNVVMYMRFGRKDNNKEEHVCPLPLQAGLVTTSYLKNLMYINKA